jgi:hypothetical protein
LRRAQIDAGSQPVRNLFRNPGAETASGLATVRTNLSTNPRGINTFADYNGAGAQTITPNVAITGNPDGFTTANRVSYTSTSNPGVTLINPVVSGTQYTIQAWIYIETLNTTPGIAGFAQAGIAAMGSPPPMTAGVWQKVVWTYTASGTSQIGFRVSGGSGGTGAFLITGVLIEAAPAVFPFFDGATAAEGDFTYSWAGTANASNSLKRASGLAIFSGQGSATTCVQSTDWAASGTKSCRVIPTGVNSSADTYQNVPPGFFLQPGTYTMLATLRLSATQTGTLDNSNRARRIACYHSGQVAMSTQSPNAPGVYPHRLTFKVLDGTAYQSFRLYNGASMGNGDVWWDNIMLVEGDYQGDYINPEQNLLSKWEGTANASMSLGYPPQLLDIAGKPILDYTTNTNVEIALPGGFTNTEGRTFYTVHDALQIPGAAIFPLVTYGATGLADSPVNQTILLRDQGNTPAVLNRRTGGGGPLVANLVVVGRNVSCWGLTDTGTQFVANNGSAVVTQPTVMDVPHEGIRIHADSTLNGQPSTKHVRTIMYRGYHDTATRLAVARYLGNKYGAAVA